MGSTILSSRVFVPALRRYSWQTGVARANPFWCSHLRRLPKRQQDTDTTTLHPTCTCEYRLG